MRWNKLNRTIKKHIRPSVIETSIVRFVKRLLDRVETIVVVGHSYFFRAMSKD